MRRDTVPPTVKVGEIACTRMLWEGHSLRPATGMFARGTELQCPQCVASPALPAALRWTPPEASSHEVRGGHPLHTEPWSTTCWIPALARGPASCNLTIQHISQIMFATVNVVVVWPEIYIESHVFCVVLVVSPTIKRHVVAWTHSDRPQPHFAHRPLTCESHVPMDGWAWKVLM